MLLRKVRQAQSFGSVCRMCYVSVVRTCTIYSIGHIKLKYLITSH